MKKHVHRRPHISFPWWKKIITNKFIKYLLAIPIILILFFLFFKYHSSIVQAIWWNPGGGSWLKRKQLNIVNSSTVTLHQNSTVAVSVDTKTLVTQHLLKSDCSDLRIVYQPSDNVNTELTRSLVYPGGGTCATSTTTRVYFNLQLDLTSSASNTNYYLYYNNTQATTPTGTDAAYNIGSKTATLVCPFDGSTTCAAGETPSTATGAIRYSGGKSALSFDGSSDYVEATGGNNLNITGSFTLELWVNPAAAGKQYDTILQNASSGNGYRIWYASAGNSVSCSFLGNNSVSYSANVTVVPNTWNHIACVYNGSNITAYLNGIGSTPTNSTATVLNGTTTVQIGRDSTLGRYFIGMVDEVRISNVARYTANFTPSITPFVRDEYTKLLYHFDENGDDPRQTGKAIDDSGNGNHGTITGAKYVAGLVGVDASLSNSGYLSNQSYAGHGGTFIEESTLNKIPNPSFENATFDTGWTGAAAQTLTLQPDATAGVDTFLPDQNPTLNYGVAPSYGGYRNRALIKFDVSSIPASAVCTSANLSIYHSGTSSSNAFTQTVYSIAAGNAGWVQGIHYGVLASAGESTYNAYAADGAGGVTRAWAGSAGLKTSGTDYETPAHSSANGNAADAVGTEYSFPLIASRVQNWFGTPNTNYGLLIVGPTGNGGSLGLSDNTTAAYRPKLVVNYSVPGSYTATKNTTTPYSKFGSNSAQITATTNTTYTTSVNPGDTNTQTLSAYVYDATSGNVGGTVSATVAKLVFNGSTVTPASYTDMGGGWWRLSYSAAGANASGSYGVEAEAGKTIYLDGVQLEEKASATTYADGSLGSGYAWTGTTNNSTSTRTVSNIQYPISSNIAATAGSVSFWLKTPWAGNDSIAHTIFDTDTSAGTLKLSKNAANNLVLTDGTNSATQAVTWSANSWQFVTADWGSSNMHVYLNGTVGTASGAYSAPTLGTNLYIGQDKTSANFLNGFISDFRVFSSVLSSTDVTDLYNAGLLSRQETNTTVQIDRFDSSTTAGTSTNKITNPSFENSTFDTNWTGAATQTLTLQPDATAGVDTYINADQSTFNHGAYEYFTPNYTSLIKFDVSSIPSNATGISAIFSLYQYNVGWSSSAWNANVYSIASGNSGWVEGTKLYSLAGAGESCWNAKAADGAGGVTTAWAGSAGLSTSGTDYEASSLGTLTGNRADPTGTEYSTALNITRIQAWWQNGTNYGLKINPAGTYLFTSDTATATYRPKLAINYTTPYTATKNTNASYVKYGANSAQITATTTTTYTTSVNPGNTNTHTLSAYVYSDGSAIDATVAKLVFNGATVTPTYTADSATGWYRLTYSAAGVNAAGNYGIEVEAGKTVYLDGVQLEENTAATSYFDGSFGRGYAWTGTANASTSTRTDVGKGQNPVAVYHMDEGYGTTVSDSTPNLNHLTLSGATWIKNAPTENSSGSYLSFNGTSDKLSRTFDQDFDFGSSPFTLSGMFRHPSTVTGTDTILARQSGSVGYKVYMNSSGYLCFSVNSDSACSTTSYVDSKWHSFSAVRGATTITLYIDDIQIAQTANLTPATVNGNNTLYIGIDSDGTSNPWAGYLDEIIFYPYARSVSQVKVDNLGNQVAILVGARQNDNLTNGLVGWWKMDEASWTGASGEVIDSSGNGNNGQSSPVGPWTGPTTGAGKFGNGGVFDGSDDYVNTVTQTALGITNDVTVNAWVKLNTGETNGIIFGNGDLDIDKGFSLGIRSSKIGFVFNRSSGNWSKISGTTTLSANVWYLFTLTYSGTTAKLYLNGIQEYSGTNVKWTNNTANMRIGKQIITHVADSIYDPFSGTIDDLRVYNRTLSPTEVQQLYNWAPPPVAQWTFDEGSGQYAYDVSGNGNTGTLGTGATADSADPTWTNGKYGKGLKFDGSNDYISAADNTSLNLSGNLTVGAWVKTPDVTLSYQQIIARGTGGTTTTQYELRFSNNTGKVEFVKSFSGGFATATSTTILSNNTWYYVAGAWDGTNISIWVNGVQENKTSSSGTPNTIASVETIGARNQNLGQTRTNGAYFYGGSIDDVRIYNYARTQKQIEQDMLGSQEAVTGGGGAASLSSAGKPSSPIAWYKFDEGYGTTFNNSGNLGSGTNATASASLTWSNSGKYGKATQFNGTTGFASTSKQALIVPSASTYTGLSWGGWVFPVSSAVSTNIMIKNNEFRLTTDANSKANCAIYTSSWQTAAVSSSALTVGAWSHVLCTYDGTTITVYVNGKSAGTAAQTGAITASSGTGLNFGWNTAGGGYFNGLLDEMKLYSYPLTSDEIKIDYNKGSAMVVGSTSTESWWLAGGVNPANAVVVYQPIGASSLASSYTNLANPGTYNAAPGTAPTWDAVNGWKFLTASKQYLTTGVTPGSSGWSAFMRYSNHTFVGDSALFGGNLYNTSPYFGYQEGNNSSAHWPSYGDQVSVGSGLPASAVIGIAGQQGYKNGVTDGGTIPGSAAAQLTIYIAAAHDGGGLYSTEYVQAFAIYNTTLTASQVAAITNAMNGLTAAGAASSNSSASSYCVPGSADPCAAPVAEWNMDEGSGVSAYDTSGNGVTGTATGTTIVNGKIGKARNFTASDNVAATITNPAYTNTLEAWVYPTTSAVNKTIITNLTTNASSQPVYGGCTGTALSLNTWTYISGVSTDSTHCTLYQNGVAVTGGTGVTYGTTVNIGNSSFTGKIDQVKIYSYARTPAQIAWDYNRGKPVAEWKMDECGGTAIHDSSGNNNTGTLNIGGNGTQTGAGTCTDGLSTSSWYNGSSGKLNASLNFDGTDDYVSVANSISTNSVSFWVKPTSNSASMINLTSGAYITASSGTISATGFSSPVYYINGIVTTTPVLTANVWNHVVVTTGTGITANAVTIGKANGAYTSGQIDDVQIYNYALTPQQVQIIYNQNVGVRY